MSERTKPYKSWEEFKPDWIKALRSGEYKQGRDALCQKGETHDKFCCLGVAADLLVLAGHKTQWKQVVGETYLRFGSYIKFLQSNAIPKWLHSVLCRQRDMELMWFNDRERKSFDEIADWIEENM